MAADAARRQHYAATMAPLGASAGERAPAPRSARLHAAAAAAGWLPVERRRASRVKRSPQPPAAVPACWLCQPGGRRNQNPGTAAALPAAPVWPVGRVSGDPESGARSLPGSVAGQGAVLGSSARGGRGRRDVPPRAPGPSGWLPPASAETPRQGRGFSLTASVLARIVWRPAAQCSPRQPGAQEISQRDHHEKSPDHTGDPCENIHGHLPRRRSVSRHGRAARVSQRSSSGKSLGLLPAGAAGVSCRRGSRCGWTVVFGVTHHRPPRRVAVTYCSALAGRRRAVWVATPRLRARLRYRPSAADLQSECAHARADLVAACGAPLAFASLRPRNHSARSPREEPRSHRRPMRK